MRFDPRGSLWHRWDPHLHAPGTVLNNQFGGSGTLDEYLSRIEGAEPAIEAIGITDYLVTSGYEAVLEAKNGNGRLPGVDLLFPNVEMRLGIETKKSKGINLHLLVSPEDDEHLDQLHRFLRRLDFVYKGDKYACTRADLIRLGRAHSSSVEDDEAALRAGVNQFKVDFRQLRDQYEGSDWMRANSLIAVAGSSSDGTAGLQTEDASFDALRKELERFADVIFSGSPKQVSFWRGDGVMSVKQLERDYAGRKPCLHGSDAHCLDDVGAPDMDRLMWLKGDLIFETLRQVCMEPSTRAYIGRQPPDLVDADRSISGVASDGAPWLLDGGALTNPGLVAVIGARGSGKTALADMIAHGGGSASPLRTADSFLTRASAFLTEADVILTWSNGDVLVQPLAVPPEDLEPEVHYLSQQFVNRLCSTEGASDELIEEVEKVVFSAHEPATRMEATNFTELLEERTGDTRQQREHLRIRLDRISEAVLTERLKKQQLPEKERALAKLRERTDEDKRVRQSIVKAGETERAAYYERLRTAIESRERSIQAWQKRAQLLAHLSTAIARYRRSVLPELSRQLQSQYQALNWTDSEWAAFGIDFRGMPESVVSQYQTTARDNARSLEAGDPRVAVTISSTEEDLKRGPLEALKAAFAKVGTEIGIDRQNAQKLRSLNARISASELEIEKAQREVDSFRGADERLALLSQDRAECYGEYFDLVVAEEEILRDLYRPLEAQLAAATDTVGRLRLVVVRHVELDEWAERGESLLDLRKSGTFKGRGSLAEFAREELLPSWESGDATAVSAAMARFRSAYDAAILAQAGADRQSDPDGYQQWTLDVGRWLYSTEHIEVRYSFEYEDLPLAQLSPGTRGMVLLLLYLALDLEDARPLVIDQPEENLDPRSVFAELVELFRRARGRRQVIIVTHNANLVVNTDVDQVIVANCVRRGEGHPPEFTYTSGSLENADIRGHVCEILEGGEAAFRERARRLRVSRF